MFVMIKVGVVLFGLLIAIDAECLDDKYKGIEGHTACLNNSADLKTQGVNEADKELIVNQHNAVRSNVPDAMDMLKMSWDDELASLAQNWANQCKKGHEEKGFYRINVGRYSVGQNAGEDYTSWSAVIAGWESEKTDFTYGVTTTAKVGHYTQLIWAKTNKVGCGYAECGPSGEKKIHVCNYGPAGNGEDKFFPYKQGTSCGDCPNNCVDNLCDCSAKECFNGGTFDVGTCNCTCVDSFYGGFVATQTPGDCALDCTAKDEKYCGTFFMEEGCPEFSNFPEHCPNMCGLCPKKKGPKKDKKKPKKDKKNTN